MGVMKSFPPSASWGPPNPDQARVAANLPGTLEAAVAHGDFPGLHGLLIVRNGRLAVECHFSGKDENWGQPLGEIEHAPALRHDLRSITKSVVSLLYGIAMADGLVPPATARLANAFPDYEALFDSNLKRRITISHVLSMRMGLHWEEDIAYGNPRNGELRMAEAPDRTAFVLGQPMDEAPGVRWVYSGGATALLGHLIERGTGMALETYAAMKLFAPLGIQSWEWARWKDGSVASSSGLRMTAGDVARIGQMLLDKGVWQGRRIVPATWLAASLKPRGFVEQGLRYGYQWWIGQLLSNGRPWHAAFGNGGQRLFVIPSLKTVVVIFAGNYNQADQWKMPARLMSRVVIPALF